LIHLAALLPLAIAAPTQQSIPELTTSEWSSIQSSFVEGARSLSSWSWSAAQDVVAEFDELKGEQGEDRTIWQQLLADPHSFSKIVKLIEFEGHAKDILDNKDMSITFFAPNNDALTPPDHHHGHHHHHDDDDDELLASIIQTPSLATISSLLDSPSFDIAGNDDDDDEKKKRRREIFRKIVGFVLKYHGLPHAYTAKDLAGNNTFETALETKDGAFGGLNQRVRVEKSVLPPSLKLNFYAEILVSDKKASNGYFHTIKYPLLPPGSLFDEYYIFPEVFSTLTSAVQKLDAKHYYYWSYDHEKSKPGHPAFTGFGLATNFAPDNLAFAKLPEGLKRFLFSPFGGNVLAKILMYHYVPKTLLLSEVFYHEKHHDHKHGKIVSMWEAEGDDKSFKKEVEVPTALANTTLHVTIDKSKVPLLDGVYKTTIKVNDHYVKAFDVPAHNGATHVIGDVLIPPHKHHDHHGEDISSVDSWSNWEEWLPAWAAEQ